MRPDIVLLHTPHGVCLSSALGVYLNPSAEGSAEWMGGWSDFRVSVRLHSERAAGLLAHLQRAQVRGWYCKAVTTPCTVYGPPCSMHA
jgi:hypothetical protein